MTRVTRIGSESYHQPWYFKVMGPFFIVCMVVVFGCFIWLLVTDDVSGRHQDFRDYCASQGGVIFENNHNFDCVLNGTHISYYGD